MKREVHKSKTEKSTQNKHKELVFFGGGVRGTRVELRTWFLQGRHSTSATPPVHFALVMLKVEFQELFCPGWLQTAVLLISASQVATIIGVSHWHLARPCILATSFQELKD
jgi:hypothetical protein